MEIDLFNLIVVLIKNYKGTNTARKPHDLMNFTTKMVEQKLATDIGNMYDGGKMTWSLLQHILKILVKQHLTTKRSANDDHLTQRMSTLTLGAEHMVPSTGLWNKGKRMSQSCCPYKTNPKAFVSLFLTIYKRPLSPFSLYSYHHQWLS